MEKYEKTKERTRWKLKNADGAVRKLIPNFVLRIQLNPNLSLAVKKRYGCATVVNQQTNSTHRGRNPYTKEAVLLYIQTVLLFFFFHNFQWCLCRHRTKQKVPVLLNQIPFLWTSRLKPNGQVSFPNFPTTSPIKDLLVQYPPRTGCKKNIL